jgi:hypothetical protein
MHVGRQTLLLRIPETQALEGDWNFHVFPGVFALFVDETIALLERSITRDREHWLAMWLFGAGWYRDYKVSCKLRNLLKQNQTISDHSLQGFEVILWWHASDSIWTKNFAYYECPTCDNQFHPETGCVYDWTIGEGLAACGGRRFTCPNNHTLYSKTEWDS